MTSNPALKSTREQVLLNIERIKERGWINTPPPVQLVSGNWVLQEVRVVTYDLGRKKNVDRFFRSWECAEEWLLSAGSTVYNVYRTPGSGRGEDWRTDW